MVDQSNLILKSGIIFGVVSGCLIRITEFVFEFSPKITFTLVLFYHACGPVLWIYLSDKLQDVMLKCINQVKSNICCC